jgi:hypothetical protein
MEKTIKVLGIDPKSSNESNIIPSEIIIRQELSEKLEEFPEWFIDYIIIKSTDPAEWELQKIVNPVLNKSSNMTNLIPVLIKRILSFCMPIIKIDHKSKTNTSSDNILESNFALDAFNKEFVNYRIASNDLVNITGLYIHLLEDNALVPIYKNNYNHFRDDDNLKNIINTGLYGWVDSNKNLVLTGPSSNTKLYNSKGKTLNQYIWDDLTIGGLNKLTIDLYKMVLWGYRNATIASRVYMCPLVDRPITKYFEIMNYNKLSKYWSREILHYISFDKTVIAQLKKIFPIPKNKELDLLYLSSIYNLNSIVEFIYMYGINHPKNKERIQLLEDKKHQIARVIDQRKQIYKSQLRMIYANKYSTKLFDLQYDELNNVQQSKIQKQLDTLNEYEISHILSKIFAEMRLSIINFYNDKSEITKVKKKLETIFNTKTTINDMYPLKKTTSVNTIEREIEGGKSVVKSKKKPVVKSKKKSVKPRQSILNLNTSIGILCPHWIEYINAILLLKPQQKHKNTTITIYDVNEARDLIVKKWGSENSEYSRRNDGKWCKICGEKLQEINEEAVAVNNMEFWSSDDEDNHIKQTIWSTLQNSIKFLKFSSTQEDPFRLIDYLITVLTPYVKNVYLEISKNKSLNENESKSYLSIYTCMYVYSSLAKLIIENPNINWNIVVKKRGGQTINQVYDDCHGTRYTPYNSVKKTGGATKDNKLIITQAYSIVLSLKKTLIDNITSMTLEKFRALFLEIFNAVYNIDGISIDKVTETFAETSNESANKYNYILGMNPIYHYAYQEAAIYSGKSVDYVDLLKIIGTDSPRKWSLMNTTKKAETIPIYNHPTTKYRDKTKLLIYEDLFNLSHMYEVDKFQTVDVEIKGGKKTMLEKKKKAKLAKTAPKKKIIKEKSEQPTKSTNNPMELYLEFFKDEIYKEYLHSDSKPLMDYYNKVDEFRKDHEQIFDIMRYMRFMPHSVYNKAYNNKFKQVKYKEKVLSASEKAKRKKVQSFHVFNKYCPFYLPKKQSHVYKSNAPKEFAAHETELDYLKPSKCIKCGWEKLYIEDQPDVWYKKWSKKMLLKKSENVTIFNRKNDTYKWENNDKFTIWKVNTSAILKLTKISGLSNNFWDNLGFMEDFDFDEITSGKKNPSKAISDDRLDQDEQRRLLDIVHKIDNHVMWIYTRLMNIKYFNSMSYVDTLNDPGLTEILKKNKSKGLEKNIKDPIPNYRRQLNWYYFNQPNIKTMNFVVNQLSTILLYIKELKEYKYLANDFFKYCIQHIKTSELLMSKLNRGRYYANLAKQFKDMNDPNDDIFGDDAAVPDNEANFGDYDNESKPNNEDAPESDMNDSELGTGEDGESSDPFSFEHAGFDSLNDGSDDAIQSDDL